MAYFVEELDQVEQTDSLLAESGRTIQKLELDVTSSSHRQQEMALRETSLMEDVAVAKALLDRLEGDLALIAEGSPKYAAKLLERDAASVSYRKLLVRLASVGAMAEVEQSVGLARTEALLQVEREFVTALEARKAEIIAATMP